MTDYAAAASVEKPQVNRNRRRFYDRRTCLVRSNALDLEQINNNDKNKQKKESDK